MTKKEALEVLKKKIEDLEKGKTLQEAKIKKWKEVLEALSE